MSYLRTMLLLLSITALTLCFGTTEAGERVITHGGGKLVIIDAEGQVEWELPWGGIHDIHELENGNIMVQRGMQRIVEIDRETKEVVWSYDAARNNGNEGRPVEVHAFQPLADGNIMLAESGPGRIIEIDREGNLKKEIKLKVDNRHPHHDTRLARKLASGNYLVCHERDGKVREYDGQTGEVVWEYEVPLFEQERRGGHGPESYGNQLFSAVRLPNGNTLIGTGNGHSVLEVTPEKEVVWKLSQNALPEITLAWVTTLEVLPNGNYVIGNCHAGSGQPLLVEIEPKSKKVVWTLDMHDTLGNDVSNSQILGLDKPAIR